MLEIDYHSHLIPGVDDGSRGGPETVAMGRALADLGVRRLHLTPHRFRRGWGMVPDEVTQRTAGVQRLFERADIDIELCPSSEHLFGRSLFEAVEDGAELATVAWDVDGDPLEQAILVEVPTHEPVVGVRSLAKVLCERGIRPLMAHPERTRSLEHNAQRMVQWRDAGWRFQLDLMSLVGTYGSVAQMLAERWCAEGAYDVAGSDLHRPSQIEMLTQAHSVWRQLDQLNQST